MTYINPFKPAFGTNPPVLVGRQDQIEEFEYALDTPGSLGRATLYTGASGSGKTVLLNRSQELAGERGWVTISEDSGKGFRKRLSQNRIPGLLEALDPPQSKTRLSSVNCPLLGLGFSWDTETEQKVRKMDLRAQIDLLTGLLSEGQTGLLITIDEIQKADRSDLEELFSVIQHCFREVREVAFVGAGLQSGATRLLLGDDSHTFIQRADWYELGAVPVEEVREAFQETIEDHGFTASKTALDMMSEATQGHPFMIQLVGHHCWREGEKNGGAIDEDQARAGVGKAARKKGSLIHGKTTSGLTSVQKTFLSAMSRDDGPSKISDIQQRMDIEPGYAGVYRDQLIKAGIIGSVDRGRIDFAVPGLREHLREHATFQLAQ